MSDTTIDASRPDGATLDDARPNGAGDGGSADLSGADALGANRPGFPGLFARVNPVLFWNDVALDLVALDHSVPAQDARAIGPCLTARALGLAHAVLADAVRLAFPHARYEAFRTVALPGGPVRDPASFVGGAVAAILRHIYDSVPHQAFIDTRRAAFLRQLGGGLGMVVGPHGDADALASHRSRDPAAA